MKEIMKSKQNKTNFSFTQFFLAKDRQEEFWLWFGDTVLWASWEAGWKECISINWLNLVLNKIYIEWLKFETDNYWIVLRINS